MLKHIDDIRKSARERAQRRWKNHQVTKNFKAARKEAAEQLAKEPKELEPADVLEQDKLIKGGMTKFESKFIKYIKEIMAGNSKTTLEMYLHSLEGKRRRLLREKLRRLQLAEAQQVSRQSLKPMIFSDNGDQ